MGEEQGGSGKGKLGLLGCLVFWVLAIPTYFWMRRTPAVMKAFETVQGWVGDLRAHSPWWLAALLGLAALSPGALIWWLWRRLKRRRES
jgi:hypothetical protein